MQVMSKRWGTWTARAGQAGQAEGGGCARALAVTALALLTGWTSLTGMPAWAKEPGAKPPATSSATERHLLWSDLVPPGWDPMADFRKRFSDPKLAMMDDGDPQVMAMMRELRELWDANGAKTAGTWAQVFGDSPRVDEIFMAWNYARLIQAVTASGKAAYNIPMYVNTWLGGPDAAPGDYPSGGPQPRVVDIWRAAGSAIDVYAPDLYASNFMEWCQRYHRAGNPLFMPETNGGSAGAANVFYAIGEEAGFGFSPFAIDMTPPAGKLPDSYKEMVTSLANQNEELSASYHAIASIMPQITAAQAAGQIHGFTLTKDHSSVEFTMGGYTLHVTLDEIFGMRAEHGYGLILAEGPDKFLGLGKGFRVSFTPRSGPQAGIAAVDEGRMVNGQWVPGRRLNGDENDQGHGWRFSPTQVTLERVSLYRFQ